MPILRHLLRTIGLIFCLVAVAQAQDVPAGYTVQDRVVVGADTVLLYADARVTPSLRDSLWGQYDACEVPSEHPLRRYCQVDLDTFFLPALVRVLRPGQQSSPLLQLAKPRASLATIPIRGLPFSEVFVTEDDTPEFGSWRGPVTRVLLIPPHRRPDWAEFKDVGSRIEAPLRLLTTGKAVWQAAADEIRSIRCQPRLVGDSVAFDITLARLRPRPDGSWERVARTDEGFWELDMGMPGIESFPPWPGVTRSNHRMKLTRLRPSVFFAQTQPTEPRSLVRPRLGLQLMRGR